MKSYDDDVFYQKAPQEIISDVAIGMRSIGFSEHIIFDMIHELKGSHNDKSTAPRNAKGSGSEGDQGSDVD